MVTGRSAAVAPVVEDLRTIFGARLDAVVVYGRLRHGPVPSLALVQTLTIDDLQACAGRSAAWHRAGAATPLLLTRTDFERSLDAFPIEYGQIIRHHEVVVGADPFAGMTIAHADLRRACEVQVKSHLLHLREDYLEGGGRHGEIDALVRDSAPGFAALLGLLAAIDGADGVTNAEPSGRALVDFATGRIGLDAHAVADLLALAESDDPSAVDAVKLFPAYLAAMERLADFVDRWHTA